MDGLRVVALGRVVLWHTFAAPWLSWIFPAMPVMFFLAGSVLAGSVLAGSVLSGSATPAAARDLLCYGLFALLGIAWGGRRPARPTARTSTARAAGGTALTVGGGRPGWDHVGDGAAFAFPDDRLAIFYASARPATRYPPTA